MHKLIILFRNTIQIVLKGLKINNIKDYLLILTNWMISNLAIWPHK